MVAPDIAMLRSSSTLIGPAGFCGVFPSTGGVEPPSFVPAPGLFSFGGEGGAEPPLLLSPRDFVKVAGVSVGGALLSGTGLLAGGPEAGRAPNADFRRLPKAEIKSLTIRTVQARLPIGERN